MVRTKSNMRWIVVTLCFVMGIVNYLDRSVLSFFVTPISKEFHLTSLEFGALSSAFAIGYFLMSFIGGWLVDRFGARKLFFGTGLLWGLTSVVFPFITKFWSAFVIRTLLGAAEGPAYPIEVKAFSKWLPQHERTRAIALAIPLAVAVAQFIAGPLVALIFSISHKWQTMFYIVGILSFILAFVWFVIFRDHPAESSRVSKQELEIIGITDEDTSLHGKPKDFSIKIGDLLKDRTLLTSYLSFFTIGYSFWFAVAWLPGYLQQAHHLNISSSALFTSLPWIGFGAGSLISGYLSDSLFKKSKSLKVKKNIIWLSSVLAGLLLIPTFISNNLMLDVLSISLTMTAIGFADPVLWALNSDVVPQRAGLSSGFLDAAYALSGLFAPIVTGYLIQTTHSFSLALILSTILCVFGGICVLVFSNPDKSAIKFVNISSISPEQMMDKENLKM